MSFTKRETLKLNNILWRMKAAKEYLAKDETVICMKVKNPYGTSFVNKEGKALDEMTKFVGSDLNQLNNAIDCLQELLNPTVPTFELEEA